MKREQRSKPGTVTVGNVMVRIYKRERQTASGKSRIVFEVADYTSGVRRFRGFSDEAEAKREAEKIARQLATGETTAATMRNSEAASYGRAVELLRPVNTSLEVAAATFAECVTILGGVNRCVEACRSFVARESKITESRTVAGAVKEFVSVTESREGADKYLKDLRSRLGDGNPKSLTARFQCDIGGIRTPDIQSWLDGLKLSPQSYNNYRTTANTLFEFALSRGWVSENPVTATKKLKIKGGDVAIFSVEQMAAMLKVADAEFLAVLALGAFAGIRTAEIQRVSWDNIDFQRKLITIKTSKAKTASRRIVPMHDNLVAWLKPYAAKVGMVWKHDESALVNRQRATAKQAGTNWEHNAMRHSFSSYRLAEAGGDAGRVAGECGNSPKTLLKHYHELVAPDVAKAWFSIAPEAPANVVAMEVAR